MKVPAESSESNLKSRGRTGSTLTNRASQNRQKSVRRCAPTRFHHRLLLCALRRRCRAFVPYCCWRSAGRSRATECELAAELAPVSVFLEHVLFCLKYVLKEKSRPSTAARLVGRLSRRVSSDVRRRALLDERCRLACRLCAEQRRGIFRATPRGFAIGLKVDGLPNKIAYTCRGRWIRVKRKSTLGVRDCCARNKEQ